jgi:hypothetical protein
MHALIDSFSAGTAYAPRSYRFTPHVMLLQVAKLGLKQCNFWNMTRKIQSQPWQLAHLSAGLSVSTALHFELTCQKKVSCLQHGQKMIEPWCSIDSAWELSILFMYDVTPIEHIPPMNNQNQ